MSLYISLNRWDNQRRKNGKEVTVLMEGGTGYFTFTFRRVDTSPAKVLVPLVRQVVFGCLHLLI